MNDDMNLARQVDSAIDEVGDFTTLALGDPNLFLVEGFAITRGMSTMDSEETTFVLAAVVVDPATAVEKALNKDEAFDHKTIFIAMEESTRQDLLEALMKDAFCPRLLRTMVEASEEHNCKGMEE